MSLRRLVPYVVSDPRSFTLVVVSGVLAAAAPIAVAGLGAALVGRTVDDGRAGGLTAPVALLAATAAGAALAAWWQSAIAHDWAFRLLRVLRLKIFDGLARATPGRVLGKRTGDLTASAVADVNTTELFFAHTAGDYLGSVLVSAAAVAVIASLNAPTALVTLAVMVLVAVVPFVLARRAGAQGRLLRERMATLGADVVDGIQGLRELAVFGQGRAYLDRLLHRTDEQQRARMRYARRSGIEQGATDLLLGGGALATLLVAAAQVRSGALDASAAPVVVVLAIAALGPIAAVSATARTLGDVRAAAARILHIIDYPAHVQERGTVHLDPAGTPSIGFQDVHFGYSDGVEVLRGVTFDVKPGETVALVGRSGAGKSTCVNLLLRFWDPGLAGSGPRSAATRPDGAGSRGQSERSEPASRAPGLARPEAGRGAASSDRAGSRGRGERSEPAGRAPAAGAVTVDGVDLREVTSDALRRLIAVVPQDVYLFNTTIRDNIRLGRPDASDQEVQAAAHLATAHEFITALAGGYDTICGERGTQLSGGQRQRIAIARALLTKAPIIVMDEAVSSLDTESERTLRQAMATVRRDHTTLIVAHRLSTIRSADRVLLLADGRVVDSGPHDELLARCAAYRDLLATQHLSSAG